MNDNKIVIPVDKADLDDIRDMAKFIMDKTDNNEIGATAIDIIGTLEKYIACPSWRIDKDGNVVCDWMED